MTKRISPIEGMLATMKAMGEGGLMRERNDVFTDELGNVIVDTVEAFDTHEWETGISKDRGEDWTIVEQYENRGAAQIGHVSWVEKMKANPELELEDINLWGL
jgi:hypothetical protein